MTKSNRSTFYSGPAPGDLPSVPNNDTETWLTDPLLILIFTEIIPDIAAFIIFLMFLTVMAVGVSLLIKHVKLMYSRRVKLRPLMLRKKRRLKRRKKVIEEEEKVVSSSEPESLPSPTNKPRKMPDIKRIIEYGRLSSGVGESKRDRNHDKDDHHRKDRHSSAGRKRRTTTTKEEEEVGILTGTKRKTPGLKEGNKKPRQVNKTFSLKTQHIPKFLQRVHIEHLLSLMLGRDY